MDEDSFIDIGVSVYLDSICDSLLDELLESVENEIEEYIMKINEYTHIVARLENADDMAGIRKKIRIYAFDLKCSMVLHNAINNRINM